MNFIKKYIEDLRKQYKKEEARKVAIKLLYSSGTVREGQVKCQKV